MHDDHCKPPGREPATSFIHHFRDALHRWIDVKITCIRTIPCLRR